MGKGGERLLIMEKLIEKKLVIGVELMIIVL